MNQILEIGLVSFQILAFVIAIWEFFKEVVNKR